MMMMMMMMMMMKLKVLFCRYPSIIINGHAVVFPLQKLTVQLGNGQVVEATGTHIEVNGSPVEVTMSYGFSSPGVGKQNLIYLFQISNYSDICLIK